MVGIKRSDVERTIYLLELVVVNAPDEVDVEDAKRLIRVFEDMILPGSNLVIP